MTPDETGLGSTCRAHRGGPGGRPGKKNLDFRQTWAWPRATCQLQAGLQPPGKLQASRHQARSEAVPQAARRLPLRPPAQLHLLPP